MKRVCIVGGRNFTDFELLKARVSTILREKCEGDNVTFICGCARGADTLGEKYAKEIGADVIYYRPDWDKLGKRAGFVRNAQMRAVSDIVIAFWDGVSRGTAEMIHQSQKDGLDVHIVMYGGSDER